MNSGETIQGGYILGERLGRGLIGQTWSALAGDGCATARPGTELVIKFLWLEDAPDWKALERIQAEAQALRTLSHPAIPGYVDAFQPDDTSFVLVMERIPGTSLDTVVASGHRFAEADIERLFADLLDVLSYLHSLRPPVIHRDVNPKNIILRPDGSLSLVDFSGVQDAVMLAWRDNSTMVGTAGYAPLEQVSGRATTRSDLYGAAATAAYLATHRHPSDWPHKGMQPDPCSLVEMSDRLCYVLGSYLQPDEALRSLPASDAAAILRGTRQVPAAPAPGGQTTEDDRRVQAASVDDSAAGVRRAQPGPEDGRATSDRSVKPGPMLARGAAPGIDSVAMRFADRIARAIESQALRQDDYEPEPVFGAAHDEAIGDSIAAGSGHAGRQPGASRGAKPAREPENLPSDSTVTIDSTPEMFSLVVPRVGLRSPALWFSGGFTVFWLGFVAFWTVSALAMGAPIFFAMFSLPFWIVGFVMIRVLLKPAFSHTELTMTPEAGLVLTEHFIGKPKIRSWPLSDIGACRVEYAGVTTNGRRERDIVLETGAGTIRFGRSLSEKERRVIARSIQEWTGARYRDTD